MPSGTGSGKAKPRVVLVGVGGYARRHLEMMDHFSDRVDLVGAVVLPSEQHFPEVSLMRSRGVEIISDFRDLDPAFRGQMDLCVIPTGIPLHAEMAVGALRLGANVLLEKPMAGSRTDALRIVEAEKAAGRWVALGFQDMYSEGVRRLKRQLLDGVIGPVRAIRLLAMGARNDAYFSRNGWAGKLSVGGTAVNDSPLNNAFAHLVNLCLFFGSSTECESAGFVPSEGNLYRAREIESFDTAVVRAQSAEGVQLWVGVSHACAVAERTSLRIEGERGHVDWIRGQCYRVFQDERVIDEHSLAEGRQVREWMYDSVLYRLQSQSGLICGTNIGLAHVEFIERVHHLLPIRTVPLALLQQGSSQGDLNSNNRAIKDIEALMSEAFESGGMLDLGPL